MTGSGTATARLGAMGDQSAQCGKEFCGTDSCQRVRVATLGDENLCCDHFLSRCYELLERFDATSGVTESAALSQKDKELVEECSRRALEVSLTIEGLSNLQRARLLDILLWASDITAADAQSRGESSSGLSFVTKHKETAGNKPAEAEREKASGWRSYPSQ